MEGLFPATTTESLLSTVSALLYDFRAPIYLMCGLLFAFMVIEIFIEKFSHNHDTASEDDL